MCKKKFNNNHNNVYKKTLKTFYLPPQEDLFKRCTTQRTLDAFHWGYFVAIEVDFQVFPGDNFQPALLRYKRVKEDEQGREEKAIEDQRQWGLHTLDTATG